MNAYTATVLDARSMNHTRALRSRPARPDQLSRIEQLRVMLAAYPGDLPSMHSELTENAAGDYIQALSRKLASKRGRDVW